VSVDHFRSGWNSRWPGKWSLHMEGPFSAKMGRVEHAYENGQLSSTTRWSAIITLTIQPPRSTEALKKNPLGLFIHAINWSQESV
jgi:type IV secretory pathway TrbF-like protein